MLLDSRRNLEYKVNISEKKERDTARTDRTRNDISKNDTNNNGVVDEQADDLTEDDKELEQFYQIQIEAMDHCSLMQLEACEELPKLKLTKELKVVRIEFLSISG